MQERIPLMAASLDIESTPGMGTTVFAQVFIDGQGKTNADESF